MPTFKQAQLDFAAHLRNPNTQEAPSGIEDRRLEIYRNLFFNSISSLIAGTFPVLKTILSNKEWEQLIRNFFQAKHNKTPHFPEIPREFVSFVKQLPKDQLRPFTYELALYEWLELHLDKHLNEVEFNLKVNEKDLLDDIPVINTVSSLQAYQFPVHQISANNQPTKPLEQPVFLLLWRNKDNQVKFTELQPFSALLFEQLKNNNSLSGRQHLTGLAKQSKAQDTNQFINFGLQTLKHWHQQNIINTIRTTS
ncbi:DNA-binding domain-containing protein [Marinicella rhabdoformis]|uniref:HvfC family RiPP maturation protein n=1 Tax=Marinicella rhabdoformis TaxID=2580566 RepID=UPI0012AECD7D|nr:putative DNA-binding domain-containing protein [Marinicella rhabdoformis]